MKGIAPTQSIASATASNASASDSKSSSNQPSSQSPKTLHKNSDAFFRDNHSLLLKGIESVKDYAIFFLDPKGNIVTWNEGAKYIKGYHQNEIIGQHFSKFYTEEAIKTNFPQYELTEALRVGRFEDEGWRVRKDGSKFWANVIITPAYNDKKEHVGFTKVTRDLTARKLAEQKLATLQRGIDAVKDYGIFLLDTQGRISSWNVGAERIKGYQAQEIVGQHFSKFYTEEAIKTNYPQQELDEALKVGRFEDEGWRVRKDGSKFWANVIITPVYNEKNEHVGFTKVTRDLTERKLAELALLKSEQNYRMLASLAPVGIFHFDIGGKLIYANEHGRDLLGLTEIEARNRGWFQLLHPEDSAWVVNKWHQAIKDKVSFNAEYRLIRRKVVDNNKKSADEKAVNEIVWVMSNARPVLDEYHEVKSYLQTITNISTHKMLEEADKQRLAAMEKAESLQRQQLAELEKHRQIQLALTDAVCHGFRNPAHGIGANNDFIKSHTSRLLALVAEQKDVSPSLKKELTTALQEITGYADSITVCVDHQTKLANDVLHLSKFETNRAELTRVEFSPNHLVNAVAAIFKGQLNKKKLSLILKISCEKNLLIKGDPNRLEEVLTNLISNAIKFTGRGQITVSLNVIEQPANQLQLTISVEDTGIGMSQEQVKHLFNRFNQNQTGARVPHRYGESHLGLHISKGAIVLMGGEIQCESELERGTRFVVTVPCEKATLQAGIANVQSEEKNSFLEQKKIDSIKKIVLIVEDVAINQRILSNFIERLGMAYKVASNGKEAVEECQKTQFALIFMDIEMPVMNGLDAAKAIRQQESSLNKQRVPIIALTGNARPEQKEEAMQAGMSAYQTKPFNFSDIQNLVAKWIGSNTLNEKEPDASMQQLANPQNRAANLAEIKMYPAADRGLSTTAPNVRTENLQPQARAKSSHYCDYQTLSLVGIGTVVGFFASSGGVIGTIVGATAAAGSRYVFNKISNCCQSPRPKTL